MGMGGVSIWQIAIILIPIIITVVGGNALQNQKIRNERQS